MTEKPEPQDKREREDNESRLWIEPPDLLHPPGTKSPKPPKITEVHEPM
jgi:hypothetical protein